MFRILSFVFVLLLLTLILAGCGENRTVPVERQSRQERVAGFPVPRGYAKAVSDARGNTVYALSREHQEIDIFVDGIRVNSLGGLGFERSNFQRLSDIGVDTDGGLLTLDTALKLLRKFSREGMFVSEFRFDTLTQPELFCVAPDGTIFVYDAAPSEIVCYSPLDGKEFNRFGRFELHQPQNLDCNKDYLWAHNRDRNSTQIFSLLGQNLYNLKEILALDRAGDFFGSYQGEAGSRMFAAPLSLTVQGDMVTILWDKEIWQERLVYGRSGDETQ